MNTFRHELPWTFERHLHSLYGNSEARTHDPIMGNGLANRLLTNFALFPYVPGVTLDFRGHAMSS